MESKDDTVLNMAKLLHRLFLLATTLAGCCPHNDTYTVIVSMDAFRWDYTELLDTPGLDEIAKDGITCVMEPSYPASTFPNHYTIATGLVPDHHGIINGSFYNPDTNMAFSMGDSLTRYNPEYYLGEPIWVTAEKADIKTACIYWVGSDVPIKNTLPTYSYPWYDNPHLNFEQRADEVIRLLSLPKNERPRLIMLYFDEPDATSHRFGPLGDETKAVVAGLDTIVVNMYRQLRSLPYGNRINIIITSDHGMTEINDERFIDLDEYLKPSWYENIYGTNPTNIYARKNCVDSILNVLSGVEHIRAWRHGEVPTELNYGTSSRCGDVIVVPEIGWQFAKSPSNSIGAHGYPPEEKDMQVIFIANGPDFKRGKLEKNFKFSNVDIYPMMAKILGITPRKTDGKLKHTKHIRK